MISTLLFIVGINYQLRYVSNMSDSHFRLCSHLYSGLRFQHRDDVTGMYGFERGRRQMRLKLMG